MTKGPTLIASNAVGSGTPTNITFSSIPQTYTDLLVKVSLRGTQTPNHYLGWHMDINSSTSNFTNLYLQGGGSGTPGSGSSAQYMGAIPGGGGTANTFSNSEIYIPNYTSSNYKSFSVDSTGEGNETLAFANFIAGLWSNTAAITSLTIYPDYNSGVGIAQYSTFTLYGISNS